MSRTYYNQRVLIMRREDFYSQLSSELKFIWVIIFAILGAGFIAWFCYYVPSDVKAKRMTASTCLQGKSTITAVGYSYRVDGDYSSRTEEFTYFLVDTELILKLTEFLRIRMKNMIQTPHETYAEAAYSLQFRTKDEGECTLDKSNMYKAEMFGRLPHADKTEMGFAITFFILGGVPCAWGVAVAIAYFFSMLNNVCRAYMKPSEEELAIQAFRKARLHRARQLREIRRSVLDAQERSIQAEVEEHVERVEVYDSLVAYKDWVDPGTTDNRGQLQWWLHPIGPISLS